MPVALTGFGEIIFRTTDLSGPTGQNGGYFPYMTSFTVTKEVETVDKFAFKPAGGTGRKQKVARFTGQENWTGTFSMGVTSWLDLQFLYGQKAKSGSITVPDVKSATVASGVITDAALVGKSVADVQVTWSDYSSGTDGPVQIQVLTTGTPSATLCTLNSTSGTLSFHASYEGKEIFYAVNDTITKEVIGLSNPTLLTGFEFYGVVSTNAGSTAAGFGLYIPSLVLDGNISFNLTGGDDEIEVPFSPVLKAGYSEPCLMIKL